ncbi:hypothetical protein Hanom_Chr09g00838141 [Helianthus anomalus]
MKMFVKITQELIAKIAPEVWTHLSFSSKMKVLYHFAPNVCNFLSFSSKYLTKLIYTILWVFLKFLINKGVICK